MCCQWGDNMSNSLTNKWLLMQSQIPAAHLGTIHSTPACRDTEGENGWLNVYSFLNYCPIFSNVCDIFNFYSVAVTGCLWGAHPAGFCPLPKSNWRDIITSPQLLLSHAPGVCVRARSCARLPSKLSTGSVPRALVLCSQNQRNATIYLQETLL